VRVATYNVKNLFLDHGHLDLVARRRAPPKRRRDLRALARVIERVDADVLALQEVGGSDALDALNGLLARPYPHARVVPGNSDRGIHLAYLSRLPFRLRSYAERALTDELGRPLTEAMPTGDNGAAESVGLRLQRDLLRCDLELIEPGLTLYNVHLKSPNPPLASESSADDVRAAEARLIAAVIGAEQQAAPARPVLLLGDFNAPWGSPSLAPLEALGFANLVEEAGSHVPSFWPGGAHIDHLLANAAAAALADRASAWVHVSEPARKGSDHYPVSIDLALR